MAIVPLRFNERMVYQQGRALQVLRLSCVGGECPSVNGAEPITPLWVTHRGLRHAARVRSVSVKAASGQGSDWSFYRDTNHQTDNAGGDGSILKGDSSVLICPHANVELLARRRVRVPDEPPAAPGRTCTEA